jgi:hypothetical protein
MLGQGAAWSGAAWRGGPGHGLAGLGPAGLGMARVMALRNERHHIFMRESKIRGKIFIYDEATGKMIEKPKRNEIAELMVERPTRNDLMLPDYKGYVCECGDACDPLSSKWRWDGQNWQHFHGYPIGHVIVTKQA